MNPEKVRSGRPGILILTALIAAAFSFGCGVKEGTDTGALAGEGSSARSGREAAFEWFYDSFDDTRRAAYDAFRTAAEDPFDPEPVLIENSGGSPVKIRAADLDTVYQGFLYDHPEIFWLSGSYSYRVSGSEGGEELADAVSVIPIPESAQELDRQIREFEEAAQEILDSSAELKEDEERARALYDSLSKNTEYVEEALYDSALRKEHTAYGAVAEKRAVCDGIALAYKYLLDRCGIRCILIPGMSEGAPHVWNTVFWDGAWHESDPTWDTASGENNSGQYFDLTTEEMNKDHRREEDGIALMIPEAQ